MTNWRTHRFWTVFPKSSFAFLPGTYKYKTFSRQKNCFTDYVIYYLVHMTRGERIRTYVVRKNSNFNIYS